MSDFPATAYFSRTYDEAYALLVEARNYIQENRNRQRFGASPALDLGYLDVSRETMRLTTRMTQVMAWLLGQRAVHDGDLSAQEAAGRFRLSAEEICFDDRAEEVAHLPDDLRSLMRRSHDLYCRVHRLDRQAEATCTATAAGAHPPMQTAGQGHDGPVPLGPVPLRPIPPTH